MSLPCITQSSVSADNVIETSDSITLKIGHAALCLKRSGEIVLQNKHAEISLSAFGDIKIKGQSNIDLNAKRHIHLNCKE